jgi:hypothetical protein
VTSAIDQRTLRRLWAMTGRSEINHGSADRSRRQARRSADRIDARSLLLLTRASASSVPGRQPHCVDGFIEKLHRTVVVARHCGTHGPVDHLNAGSGVHGDDEHMGVSSSETCGAPSPGRVGAASTSASHALGPATLLRSVPFCRCHRDRTLKKRSNRSAPGLPRAARPALPTPPRRPIAKRHSGLSDGDDQMRSANN